MEITNHVANPENGKNEENEHGDENKMQPCAQCGGCFQIHREVLQNLQHYNVVLRNEEVGRSPPPPTDINNNDGPNEIEKQLF